MTDIQWACEWVGWRWYSTGAMWERAQGAWGYRSLPDLAEAVRVKFLTLRLEPQESKHHGWGNPSTRTLIAGIWMSNGPLAFIRAVREVVDES